MKPKIQPVISLWILVALSLMIFLAISFTEDFHIGKYRPTRATFRETLLATPLQQTPDTVTTDTLPPVAVDTLVEPDTTIRKVLIFGDSMTHNLAMSIARYGSRNNYKVTSVTWESSSILAWGTDPKLSEYLAEVKPDFVIVSLGSNEMELKNFDARGPYVKKIIEKIDTLPYIWVGPPLWKEDRGLYAMLEKNVEPGKLFRIESLDLERGPDHVHPTRKGADIWADTLMRWQLKTEHPIPADIPDSATTTKGHRFIYLHPDN